MLDINKIRDNKEEIKNNLLKRVGEEKLDLDLLLTLDDKRKELIAKIDEKRSRLKAMSKQKPTAINLSANKDLSNEIKKFLEPQLRDIENDLGEKMAELPNITAADVVAGGKENNRIIDTYGERPKFNFEPKDHVALATNLKLIDYERAAKMSGAGFWIYTGKGAELEWALLNYFIDFHKTNGYTFILPPYLLNEKSAYTSGHLPKFKDDLFWTQDNSCLNATSEMMLGNYYRDEIIDGNELPIKYFAYSACFRREAGAYRTDERGMIRGHQFNKIEMFQFTKPEQSWQAFEELTNYAKRLVEGLGLHFNTVQLAAEDCSAAMAKTIDLEVYIPSMQGYKEVSSISNALDYQARRGNIRFKNKETNKNEFIHTLNASGLATSRLLPAILEQFQQADGSVIVPEALVKYCGFKEIK